MWHVKKVEKFLIRMSSIDMLYVVHCHNAGMAMLPQMTYLFCLTSISKREKSLNDFGGLYWMCFAFVSHLHNLGSALYSL